MSLKSIKILGVTITTNSKNEILEYVRKYLAKSSNVKAQSSKVITKPLIIVTPNPEQVVLAQRDKHFAQILNQADVAIPDGIGISLAVKFLNAKWQMPNTKLNLKRIAGVELMENLVGMAQKEGVKIGLIGGRGGVAVKAFECLKTKYPELHGWAEEGPEVNIKYQISNIKSTNQKLNTNKNKQLNNIAIEQSGEDITQQYIQEIIEKIMSTRTSLVFVGLGAPKQEFFIEAVSCQLSAVSLPLVLMSVGGSFDILAGRVPRAPFIMRHVGLEWLWRLVREPWRWKRQLRLLQFLWLVLFRK